MTTTNLTLADFESTIVDKPESCSSTSGRHGAGHAERSRPSSNVRRRIADIVHAKVDTEAEAELAAIVGINSIPTVMAFRDGVLVYRQPGAMPPRDLEDLIRQVEDLDMENSSPRSRPAKPRRRHNSSQEEQRVRKNNYVLPRAMPDLWQDRIGRLRSARRQRDEFCAHFPAVHLCESRERQCAAESRCGMLRAPAR